MTKQLKVAEGWTIIGWYRCKRPACRCKRKIHPIMAKTDGAKS